MTTGSNELGARLKEALDGAGLSQAGLAGLMDVTRGQINHWVNGRQSPSKEQLGRIGTLLQVDLAWLGGPQAAAAVPDKGQPHEPAGPSEGDFHWREAPAEGGRDFGNSNAYATPTDIRTFVRESAQNSKDQRIGPDTRVHIRYRVIELKHGSVEFDAFYEAAKLAELRKHLAKAAKTRSKLASRLREGLRRLDNSESLVLVRVDDYGTTGLFGEESGGTGPFAALIRDNLNSSKILSSASGSFGVGKAVLWRSSDISTVFAASEIEGSRQTDEARGKLRIIGKSELTWHDCDGDEYAGPGWFGAPGSKGDSLKLDPKDELIRSLQLDRCDLPEGVDPSRTSGTSLLIVGFRDLSADAMAEPKALAHELAREAAENFWPLIVNGRLEISVERFLNSAKVETIPVNPQDVVPDFCNAFQRSRNDEVADELVEPGDVVRIPFDVTVPSTRKDAAVDMQVHGELTAKAHLVVRLADPTQGESAQDSGGRHGPGVSKIALIRGGGLVIDYWSRREIVVGGRSFYGVLITGEGVASGHEQAMAEQFLRAAEPPAHDKWELTDDVRDNYKRGAGKRINEMFDEATRCLRDVIEPDESEDGTGPQELMKLLRIGKPDPKAPAATIRRPKSLLADGKWTIEAEVFVNDKGKAWSITPRLLLESESRAPVRLSWSSLTLVQGEVEQSSETTFKVPARTRSFRIKGTSDASTEGIEVSKCRARMDLQIKEA